MAKDVKALIAEAREFADRSNGLNWQGRIRELADALEAAQRREAFARLREIDEALEAVQRTPAVDKSALLDAIGDAMTAGYRGGNVHNLDVVTEHLLASGILQDAAEVEARGLEAFGFWLLDIGHMPDLGRANMKFLVEQFARAQQVREARHTDSETGETRG